MSDPQRPHTAAGVAHGVVDALRSAPVVLAVVLLNLAFVAGGAYFLVHHTDAETERISKLLDKCLNK